MYTGHVLQYVIIYMYCNYMAYPIRTETAMLNFIRESSNIECNVWSILLHCKK